MKQKSFVWLNLRAFDAFSCTWDTKKDLISAANGQVLSLSLCKLHPSKSEINWFRKCNFMQPWAFRNEDNTSGNLNHSLTRSSVDVWALRCENFLVLCIQFQFSCKRTWLDGAQTRSRNFWIAPKAKWKMFRLSFSVLPRANPHRVVDVCKGTPDANLSKSIFINFLGCRRSGKSQSFSEQSN